jgi:hypothetical protein
MYRIFLKLLFLFFFTTTLSAELCTPAYFKGCETLDGENSTTCHEKFYACGEYDRIIQHYSASQFSNTSKAHYYQGVAYYGLALRTRANSYRCEYAQAARQHLLGYLGDSKDLELKKAYHATKLYEKLSEPQGCWESGMSMTDILSWTKKYNEKLLDGLFLPSGAKGAVANNVNEKRKLIQKTLTTFATLASSIETRIALRRQALDASNRRIKAIIALYEGDEETQAFGSMNEVEDNKGKITEVKPKLILTPTNSQFGKAKENASQWAKDSERQYKAFEKALGNLGIEEYEATRERVVRETRDQLKLSEAYNLIGKIFPKDTTDLSAFSAIKKALHKSNESELNKIYTELKNQWYVYGEQHGYCKSDKTMVWYCPEG